MLYECKKFLDTNIYRSLHLLACNYAPYYINMRNDMKPVIGKELFELISICISKMSLSYYNKDKEAKLKYAYELKENLFLLEIKLKIIYDDFKIINEAQYNVLCKDLGKIEEQLKLWIDKLNT